MSLRDSDIRTVAHWLSPEYMIQAAKSYDLDPVIGCEPAAREVRGLMREYARFVRVRDKQKVSLELAQSLRAMGYAAVTQRVEPLQEEWRDTACVLWADGHGQINGETGEIEVGAAKQSLVNRVVLASLASFFKSYPQYHLAILQGRIYRRLDPGLMMHLEGDGVGGVRSVVLRVSDGSDASWQRAIRLARKRLRLADAHPLRPLAYQLMRAWAGAGLIHSPAGAMVSFAAIRGWAALAPFNGIPLAVQVGPVSSGTVRLYMTIDHRAYDGSFAATLYEFMRQEVKSRCG